MCGRFAVFRNENPRYNIAPTTSSDIIIHYQTSKSNIKNQANSHSNQNSNSIGNCVDSQTDDLLRFKNSKITSMKWGINLNSLIINIRDDSRSFKKLRQSSRCIIPADAYYEWEAKTQPYCILSDKKFYFAGVYQLIQGQLSFLIFTTRATKQLEFMHKRMPVLVPHDKVQEYLDPKKSFEDIKFLLRPVCDGYTFFPVSSFVGSTKNEGVQCIQPIELPPKQSKIDFKNSSPEVGGVTMIKSEAGSSDVVLSSDDSELCPQIQIPVKSDSKKRDKTDSESTGRSKFKEGVKSKLKGAAKPEYKGPGQSKFKGAAKSEPKSESNTKLKGAAKPEYKGPNQSKLKGAATPEYKGPGQSKFKGAAKSESKSPGQSKFKDAPKSESKSESNTKIKGAAKSESKSESNTKLKGAAKSESKSEANTKIKGATKSGSKDPKGPNQSKLKGATKSKIKDVVVKSNPKDVPKLESHFNEKPQVEVQLNSKEKSDVKVEVAAAQVKSGPKKHALPSSNRLDRTDGSKAKKIKTTQSKPN